MNLKNRIAVYYLVVTALLTGLLFLTIYLVVFNTVYSHLDNDLTAEYREVYKNITVLNDRFVFNNQFEWGEREHGQIEVNPIFVQITDSFGNIIHKTGNLYKGQLYLDKSIKKKIFYNSELSGAPTRSLQMPILSPLGKVLGFLTITIPLEESALVLENLEIVLIIAFPLVLFVLFGVSRFIAGKTTQPINKVISSAQKITKENLDDRIILPAHKDEIYILTETINELLNRLEDALLREKQFTSDASHELRTPLAVLKGTLEVLIRKPRDVEHYEDKISYCITEVDRMSRLIDQLLLLARFDSGKIKPRINKVYLPNIIEETLFRLQTQIDKKKIEINFEPKNSFAIEADESLTEIIIENILTNSIKYSEVTKPIEILLDKENDLVKCRIIDKGIGMTDEQVNRIFDRFYRADESRNSGIDGSGLGLAIVKKLADMQNISINVESEISKGTIFTILFSSLQN